MAGVRQGLHLCESFFGRKSCSKLFFFFSFGDGDFASARKQRKQKQNKARPPPFSYSLLCLTPRGASRVSPHDSGMEFRSKESGGRWKKTSKGSRMLSRERARFPRSRRRSLRRCDPLLPFPISLFSFFHSLNLFPSPSSLSTPQKKKQAWLDGRHAVVGTKCNQLLLVDVDNRSCTKVRLPPAHERGPRPAGLDSPGHGVFNASGPKGSGMHTTSVSPDGRLLACGGSDATDAQIFRIERG